MSDPVRAGRRSYLVNRDFQLRFVAYALLILVVSLVIIYISNLYFFWQLSDVGHTLNLNETHPFFRFIGEQRRLMNKVFLFTGGGLSVVILLGGVFLSHRIAGPISRIEAYIASLLRARKGEFPPSLSFRHGDFFPELAEHVNALAERLKTQQGKDRG